MPTISRGHSNAAANMIAERVADLITRYASRAEVAARVSTKPAMS